MDFLEFPDAFKEDRGAMNPGRLKMTNQGIVFKNSKTGKVDQIQGPEIETVNWQRLASGFGIRIMTKGGQLYRFGGFQDTDHDRLGRFFSNNLQIEQKNKDMCLKGWNWGTAKFHGSVLSFDVDKSSAFEIPLGHVSHCNSAKNEVTLEFHQNDDAAVSLMELRFHIPTDNTSDVDPVQAFLENVLAKASIIQATGDAIVTFKELQCLTPRGRYDIKVFPSFIQLHGKTFDYKIPLSTVLRLFLLPHKDNRQTFFVLSLDPPIKQGQTRYHFLILLFNKEDEISLELGLSEEDIKEKYDDKLQKEMSGRTFEVITQIMKVLVQRKITVPGSFKGHSGTNAITCSYRAGNGLLYPLERGFIYIHKPPVHIRFDEVAWVNFARSGGSTRSFDFEIETKNGVVHTFSSIEKEEYSRLFDFVTSKDLRIKNRGPSGVSKEKPVYKEDEIVDSDMEDEPDAYLQRVKDEGRQREGAEGSSEDESDESFNPEGSGSEVAEEFDTDASSSSDSDEGSGSGSDKEKKKSKEKVKEKKSKSAKTVKEPGTRKKRKKQPKDENRPKRPPTAYLLWLNENRKTLKQENPKITITELTKKAGEAWREVSDKSCCRVIIPKEEKLEKGEKKSPKKQKEKRSPSKVSKSPTKPNSQYKSKEYISTSNESEDDDDDDDDKPLKPKKEKLSDKEMNSSVSSEEEMSVSGSD
ncbi:FACT complex subunit Ssrp1-like [Centruroides sculpturatus]|uniref:FACT complex subunit Ssrp1-like n=1 Tax=Centruroides sculpturatus TaxID=218467 RepID=UPI000C6D99E6|nr:FACT complex subunit Ssrp1-like [Centruroides sculpturatus]